MKFKIKCHNEPFDCRSRQAKVEMLIMLDCFILECAQNDTFRVTLHGITAFIKLVSSNRS